MNRDNSLNVGSIYYNLQAIFRRRTTPVHLVEDTVAEQIVFNLLIAIIENLFTLRFVVIKTTVVTQDSQNTYFTTLPE